MPHLQFETTATPTPDDKREFAARATDLYADAMDTGTEHVAVTIRECPPGGLALGRADPDEDVAVLNADVRSGRSAEQRRAFAESRWTNSRPASASRRPTST